MSKKLFDYETLPRSSDYGMSIELPAIAYTEQGMQKSRIPNVNLRGFYQPLTNVRVPRLEHTYNKCAG